MKPLLLMLCLGTALWCDCPANAQEAAAPDAPAVDAPAPEAPAPFEVPNADMTEGDDVPTGWQQPETRGTIIATRDTELFRSAPASLCLTGSDPNPLRSGTARLVIHNGDTKKFTLSGFIGSQPGVRRSLTILYNSEDNANRIGEGIYLGPHQDTWLPFSKTITLPAYVTEFTLALGLVGAGSAWLDDLKVSAPDAPAPPAPNP